MALGNWIIDRLPSSKRAVRQAREEIDDLRRENRELLDRLARIEDSLGRIEGGVEGARADLAGRLDGLRDVAARQELLGWACYRREGEGDRAARRRLFSGMPPAGDLSRLLQLGCDQLLEDFDGLCERLGLRYWALSGTLLGAVRHGGFIPWDDDLDVGMMRGDIRLLRNACAGTPFTVDERVDPWVECRQVRFRRRDADNPCFIDLFIHDWSVLDARAAYDARCDARAEVVESIEAHPALGRSRAAWDAYALDQDPADAAWLVDALDRAVAGQREAGEICDGEGAASIVWSVDNLGGRFPRPAAFPVRDVFPCSTRAFGYGRVRVPADAAGMLHGIYGDYLQLPSDMASHFRHVPDQVLLQPEVRRAVSSTLSEARRVEFDAVLASWRDS